MKLTLLASCFCIVASTASEVGICEEQEEASLLQLQPALHLRVAADKATTKDGPAAIFQVIPPAAPQPESSVMGLGGIYVSYMPVPSPPAPSPVPGRVMRFAGGSATTVIEGLEGNAGLAINSLGNKLYVTSAGAVKEYNLNSAGTELSRSFDVSSLTATTNGLCISHDDSLLYVTEPGCALSPFGVVPNGEHPTLLAIDLTTGDVQVVFHDEPGQSPNGCYVSKNNRNKVFIINMQHGLTAWHRTRARAIPISWATNLAHLQQAQGDQHAGDGLVFYKGKFYASLWKYVINAEGAPVQSGTIYACRRRNEPCQVYAEGIAAADIQLGMGNNGPMLLAPDVIGGTVNGVSLPEPRASMLEVSDTSQGNRRRRRRSRRRGCGNIWC